MKALVKIVILQFCAENNILQDFQHGHRRGRTCLSNLLACLEIWPRAIEEGFGVDVMYIDVSKAFDTVPYQRLLHKLSAIGIRGDLLNWIGAFLVGRKRRVCIGDDMSKWVNVSSGVPQGSVLRPLLFLLYVNDSLQELECGKIMFADDVKLWQFIKSPYDQTTLQSNLHRLQAWSEKWLLDFNVQKCAVVHLRPTKSHSNESLRTYHLKDIRLPAESSQKDLGCHKAAKAAIGVMHAIKTEKILHYNSNHPPSHKRSCVRTLFRRINTHCSTEAEKLRERETLWHLFLANGYPRSFVNKCLYQRHTRADRENTQRPATFRVLPYVRNVSEATERMLRPLSVGVGHRPEATIRRLLMQPKGRLPPADTSGVIYRVKCLDCLANYCGMTDKRLRTRVHGHALAVKRKDVRSHVAMHCLENNHVFDFDGAQVLGRAESKLAREVIEAWQSDANSINRSIDLPAPYEAIRHHLRARGEPIRGERDRPIRRGHEWPI
nr:unnamed protein product [Spirometra erinaceieuropaei]